MKPLKALVVEDSEDDALMLLRHLRRGGYEVEHIRVEDAASMESAISEQDWDIILSDYSMPSFDGLMALAIHKQSGKDVPFIMISGTIGEDTAVQAMLAGVDDYFVKGNLNRLIPAIERELKEAENRAARRRAELDLKKQDLRLRLALQGAGMGVWEWDLKTNAVYWSPEVYGVFGTDEFDGTMEGFKKFVHPEDLDDVLRMTSKFADDASNFRLEFRIVKPNGEVAWVADFGVAEYDETGAPVSITGTVQDITERKNRETAIKESEENLRAIIQASTQYVWSSGENGTGPGLLRWFSSLSGREVKDLDDMLGVIHPDDRDEALESWREALANRTFFSMIIRFLKSDGDYCYMATRAVPVFNSNGTFRQWIGTCNDISKRMQAEDALKRNEIQLQLVADTVPTMISRIDRDLNATFMNKAALEWFKVDRETGIGSSVMGLFSEDQYDVVKDEFERALRGEKFVVERGSSRKPGGWVQIHYVPEFDERGEVSSFFAFIFDLTDLKRNEEDLRKSEERFRSLVNATAQIVWTADADGRIVGAMTPDGTVVQGVKADPHEAWLTALHPDDKERVLADYYTAIQRKRKYKSEYRLLASDGTFRHYVARGTPVYERDGTIREWVGTMTDITKAKRAEEELRRSEEQLRQAQKLESVGRLAGGIAHDFNNMLTAINGYSDLTLRRLGEQDPLRRNIEEIKKAGERSAALTQQLLAFSRRTILQMKIVNINQIVTDSIIMFQRLIGEDIQILSILNPDVSSIKADSGQLAQMLLNLVVNARDAMPQGGTITIETDNIVLDDDYVEHNPGSRAGNYVMLSVNDTGVGIDEEMRAQIFEPFFTTKEMGKGTGLGLSTVYGIVNQLGGHIAVHSRVGLGSTFEIFLPSERSTEEVVETRLAPAEFRAGVETILLVEDEDLVRNLSRQVLETCGYKVIEARNGFEALEICSVGRRTIDLLLTDVVMPQMSGRELAERIVAQFPGIKVLFTSGYTEDGVVRHGVRESEMNFIQKPFSFEELSRKVRELLDGGRVPDEVTAASEKPA